MANIDITVSNGLYGIVLDQYDWTSLTVVDNGQNHTVQQNANGGWAYTQTVEGPIKFTATADNVRTANPGAMMILTGTNQNHLCAATYTALTDNPFTLTAVCCNVPTGVERTGPSPILFSQNGMTGSFTQG